MSYDPQNYQSKNIYLPKDLAARAEKRAKGLYMNFSTYVRHLIVSDVQNALYAESRNQVSFGN